MNGYRKFGYDEAASFIKGIRSALIVCHVNPDGDAVGSSLALKRILTSLGADVKVASPGEIPDRLSFLTDGEEILRDAEDAGARTVITVDVASLRQLGDFSDIADSTSLMIDHHANGTPFAPNIIDPEASAAGEIVYSIYRILTSSGDIPEDADTCRLLFAAISSDTGSFKYSNTTPETFTAASYLTRVINSTEGLSTSDISRLLHDTVTEKDLKINTLVSEKIKLYEDGSLAVCTLSKDDISKLGASDSELGGAIDVVRSLKGVLVAALIRQTCGDPAFCKISSRANADIDVSKVCAKFGGGGHVRAAGATVEGDLSEVAERATEEFCETVRCYKAAKCETESAL